ncbi:MAG: abortive infection family protein [Zunongwangia sp.]|uniref:abortive infection family protein n=1 Tax=Zunongwangia sp. TaxID=1965325 RepID=UPI003242E63B|tara:strand:- start:604 stop:1428 length:825 start_codon:yes stop_codon:yes gene_type:complete
MAELKFRERKYIEKLFEMSGGYVLDFSNRSFREFVLDSIKIDIDEEKYYENGASKANRLRTFFKIETGYNAGTLIESLSDYWLSQVQMGERNYDQNDENLYKECLKLAERLKSNGIVDNLDALEPNSDDKDFAKLSEAIKECIENNKPETGLDRLHTFVTKYIRELCEMHGIRTKKDIPLHSLFGMYIKSILSNGLIESEMSIRILKSSISVMESFNTVRNEKSFAHDNPILNYSESVLIFNAVSNTIKFIETIEHKAQENQEPDLIDWENWAM